MPLDTLNVGDLVARTMGGKVVMTLKVTAMTDRVVCCGPWTFLKSTGGEIDEDLGWDGETITGSTITPVGDTLCT